MTPLPVTKTPSAIAITVGEFIYPLVTRTSICVGADGPPPDAAAGRRPHRFSSIVFAMMVSASTASRLTKVLMTECELSSLPQSWAAWVIENLALGISEKTLLETLSNHHVIQSPEQIDFDSLRHSPGFQAAVKLGKRVRRMEAALATRYAVRRLKPAACLTREHPLSSKEFFDEFYSANEPVLLRGMANQWPIVSTWSPAYLRDHFGDVEVEVQTGRDTDKRYEVNIDDHRTCMPMRQFVDLVSSSGSTNDFYMCANNRALDSNLSALFDEIPSLPDYFAPENAKGRAFLWFGPEGTITPLHFDKANVLLLQVYGAKEVTLAPPEALPFLYNDFGVFSEVDYFAPDYQRYPLLKRVSFMQAMLHPGDALFLPVGWWHAVQSLSVSISLSFTNFTFPNSY